MQVNALHYWDIDFLPLYLSTAPLSLYLWPPVPKTEPEFKRRYSQHILYVGKNDT